jgi:membrane-bound lytic murein transglycosylase C
LAPDQLQGTVIQLPMFKPLFIVLSCTALIACAPQQVIRIAMQDNPADAMRQVLRDRAAAYEQDPRLIVRDARHAHRQMHQLASVLRGEASGRWGDQEARVPSEKEYVKYTQNYLSRAVVDFDAGLVTVETLDHQDPAQSLRNAIVTTLLTPDDPRAVDLYSDRTVELTGSPYLHGLVLDHRGRPVGDPAAADAFAEHLIATETRERRIDTPDGRRPVSYVQVAMVPNHLHQRAQRYAEYVARHSQRFDVSRSLVYAVIEVESAFNPFAVSHAPAYGLMQLVPTSGGRDAYRHVNGVDRVPSSDYLFDPNNNIELGTSYLNMLGFRYLAGINDPDAREYAVIAAYNGGASRVLRTFHADPARAVEIINGMHPADVYRHIVTHHPAAETRDYVARITQARRTYANT